jgi:ureidoglycolate lyase
MARLTAMPLTAVAFAPFGRVIEAAGPARIVNAGTALRHDQDAGFGHDTAAPLPRLAVYRAQPSPLPATVPLLERHPHSSQTFLPMATARWLVVVAVDPRAPAAFLATGRQGVTYAPGTWHSPLLALDGPTDFVMLMWELGGDADTELHGLEQPIAIDAGRLGQRSGLPAG